MFFMGLDIIFLNSHKSEHPRVGYYTQDLPEDAALLSTQTPFKWMALAVRGRQSLLLAKEVPGVLLT